MTGTLAFESAVGFNGMLTAHTDGSIELNVSRLDLSKVHSPDNLPVLFLNATNMGRICLNTNETEVIFPDVGPVNGTCRRGSIIGAASQSSYTQFISPDGTMVKDDWSIVIGL